MIVEYKACTSVLSPCLSCLVFTPCPSYLFFFCHLYNRCCLSSVLPYPLRFASIYPLRFSLMLCFVLFCCTGLLCCLVLVYCCWLVYMGAVVCLIVVPLPFSLSFLCLFCSDSNTPTFSLQYKHKKPYHICFAIGYKKTAIKAALFLF